MSEQSILQLFDKLCDLHLRPIQRAYRLQPKFNKDDAKSALKKVLFNSLFGYLHNNSLKDEKRIVPFGKEKEEVLLEIYQLRGQRKYEEADRLEELFNQLRKDNSNSEVWNYLKFIVALKNTAKTSNVSQFGEDVFHYPMIERKKVNDSVPHGPLNYGDLKRTIRHSQYYINYPREVFQIEWPELLSGNEKALSRAFKSTPGMCLGPDSLFTTKFLLGDHYEQITQDTLYGSLTQGRFTDLEMKLELPNITSVPELQIPKFKSRMSHSESEESGLGSECVSMSSSLISHHSTNTSGYDDSIWEKALTDILSEHVTWEWRGYQAGPTERPYLTETGPAIIDLLIQYKQTVSSLFLAEDGAQKQLVTVDVLMQHLLLMLMGVPSVLFPFDSERQCFNIIEGLHISGTFPEMLSSFLSEFVNCGTFYVRLKKFSQPPVLDSFYKAGLVFQAFCSATRKVLLQFTAEILSISQKLTLMQLSDYLHRSMLQIRYLAQLCGCCDSPTDTISRNNFPTGMKLLSYLYEETQMSVSSPHYAMLLSILQSSCAPLILFLKDWIFQGIYRDFYGEFMIIIDEDYLIARDEHYWNKAYTLRTSEEQGGDVPEFLLDIIKDTVTCGKSINLLRICSPQHFLCNVPESTIPPVTITFSQNYIREIQVYCETYVSRMRQISRQLMHDREEILKQVERQKVELQQTARLLAQKEISRLQGIIDERKAKSDAKKRIEFQRLKKQMEDDLQRRSTEQEEDKESDRQYMARVNKEEDALTEQEIELEKKARDELIAYYTELNEEAMHRERIALWRIRRAQLENVRFLFLEADAKRWQQELQNHEDDVDGRLSPSLPRWAERALDRDYPLEVNDLEEISLPQWAERELAASAEEVNVLDSDVPLPRWAQESGHGVYSQPRIISSGEEEETTEVGHTISTIKTEPFDILGADLGKEKSIFAAENDAGDEVVNNENIEEDSSSNNLNSLKISGLAESAYQEQKPQTQRVGDIHVSDESSETLEPKPQIKMVKGMKVGRETKESVKRQHIKASAHMSATRESDTSSSDHKPHLKFRPGQQVNKESDGERALVPKKLKGSENISSESKPKVWEVKKPSKFGHASQVSNSSYVLNVPKLRKQNEMHASMESSYKDFSIKAQVRANKLMFASKESDAGSQWDYRPHIRIMKNRNSNTESLQEDENALIRKRFLSQNFRGHSSDSTIQKLLYGDVDRLKPITEDTTDGPLERITFNVSSPYTAEFYQKVFTEFADELNLDLMSLVHVVDLGKDLIGSVVANQEELEAGASTPLSVLLACSLTAPIKAQMSLVNSVIINYFTSELKVDSHFEAIKRYLLMADGDFAEILANILFEKLITNPLPQEMINPVFLNGALNKAIRSSIHSDDVNTKNLSFVQKNSLPAVLLPNDPNSLQCLELRYIVKWPLTIVFTESCMKKYYSIFNFLLQIKRVVWVLKDVWHQLKRDAVINKAGNSSQFRQLQLYRQEMQHFVKMMQGYITNQVIHISWQEFQSDLSQPIDGLDQLCHLHERFVDRALFRCLLDNKAIRVWNIIQDIFCLILKFRSQLVSGQWQRAEGQKETVHNNFAALVNTYQSFHVYSLFLFKVVSRLSQKGYQPHLQELLLQLNFNNYYTQAGD